MGGGSGVGVAAPHWAWIPKDGEVFAAADPGTCRPMMCDPVVDDDTRAPGVIEPLHVMETDERGFGDEPHVPFRLPGDEAGVGHSSSPSDTVIHGTPTSSTAVPVLKDSTRHAFEVRLRADWVGSRRVSFGAEGTPRESGAGPSNEFSFATPAGGFGSPFGAPPPTQFTGGSVSSASDGSPVGLGNTALGDKAASAKSCGSVGLVSIFTGKYLQARRKRPHRLQFFGDKRGVYETWEVIGGARSKLRRWRAWGALAGDGVDDGGAIKTTIGSASASASSAASSRFMGGDDMRAALVDLFERDVPFERLGSRDVLVVRSKQSPRRCLLLVRLTLATGEPVVSQSPGKSGPSESGLGSLAHRTRRRSSPTPRRSEGSIRFTMHDDSPSEVRSRRESRTQSVGSVSGRESPGYGGGQGEVTASLDALDVMQLSNKLLAGFARGRGETRRAQRQAYFAWKAHTRETVHAQARAEMMGTLYEKKWRQRLFTAWERRTSERRAKRCNQERMNLRVRQWRARWTWRRCTLGFVRWRLLARKAAAAGEFLERFARRWMHSVASRSFARWRVYVSDTARMRVAARRVVRRMRSVKLSAAFDRWSESAGDSRSARRKLYSAATALRKTHVRRAFRQWSDATETTRRRGHAKRRADVLFVRSTRAFKSDAFVSWANFATAKRISRYRFEKVSARWRRLETVRPLRAWREQARHVRTIRAHMRSTYLADLKHLERGAVRRAMAWWRLWTESTRRTRLNAEAKQRTELRLLEVVANRMRRFVAASAFERWREVIRAVRAERRAVKFVRGLLNRRLATAFAGWRDSADRRISAREKIAFVVTRMTASLLARAFTTWASATERAWARRVKGERAERFLLRMMNARAASAFSRWKECVEDSRKRVHFLSGHERARSLKAQNRALRVMSAWKGYTTHKAIGRSTCEMAHKMLRKKRMEVFLKTWRLETHWKDTVERRRLVSICQRRCGRREMNRRFAHWRTYRGRERRQRLAIARLLHAKTYAAFSTWRDHANDQRAFLRRMEKVMRRWLRLSLSYPFERWCESVDERKRLRGVLERCTLRMGNRCTAAAFARWSETVVRRREWGAAERRAEHLCRRMVRAAVASAFDGWIDAVKRNASKRETAHRLLIRWQNLHAAHYFDTWADAVETSRERRVLFRKTVVRIRNVKLNAAWNAWTDAKTGGRRLRRIARRLRDLRSSQTLSSWRQICERRNAARATLRRCERFMHRVLTVKSRVAFVTWLDTFRHRRTGRRLAFIASIRSRRADLERRFKRWAAPVKNKKRLNLYVVSRAVTMQRTRAMKVQCFAEWTRVVDGRGVRDDKSAVMRARHAIRRAMVRWRFVTGTNKERGVKIKFALRRWRGRAVGECFRAWVDITRVRKRSLRFFARLTRRSQLAAFNAWATNAADAKRKRYNLQKVVNRWRRLRLAAPFQDWIEWIDDVRDNRATMNKVLRRVRRVVSYAAFNTWREAVGSIRRHRALIGRAERVVRRLVARDASRALVSWRDFVWKRRKLRGLLERWRRRDLSVAFRTWMEAADEAAGSRATLLVAVNKMLKRRQSAAFNQWLDATWQGKARAGNLRKMHKFARRMADRTSAAAFTAWLEYAIHRAATRMSIQRIAARWMRLTLAVPFNAWCDWTDEVKGARLKVVKFLHRMKTVYSTRAFYAWVDTWLERRRVRHSMSRAERYFKRLASQSVAKVFNTWAENVVDNRRRRYALEKIITRWQRLQLAALFSDWVEWVDAVQGNRTKIRKFVHRIRTVYASAAFARWDEVRVEMKRQRHALARADRYFQRAVSSSVTKAFNTWAGNAAEMSRRRRGLEKVVVRWRRLQLAAPFGDWAQWVDEVRGNRNVLRVAVHRMRTVKVASAFATWRGNWSESKEVRAATSRATRFFGRLTRRSASRAFNSWADNSNDRKHRRAQLRKVVARWQRTQLAAPFGDWVEWVDEVKGNRLKVAKFLHRMKTVYSTRAFYAWVDFSLDARRQRHAVENASRFFQRIAKQDYARAFFAWRANASDLNRKKKSLAKLVTRWRRLQLHYPFRAWRDWLDETLGNRDVLRLVVHRMSRFALYGAFARWKDSWIGSRERSISSSRADVVIERFIRRASRRELSRAFNRWIESTHDAKRARYNLRKVCARWQRLRLSVPFNDWVEWRETVATNRLKISRCVHRLRKGTAIAAWTRWIDFSSESKRGRVLAARAGRCLARLVNRAASRAFATWSQSVGRDVRHRAALRKIVTRWRKLQLAAPFNDWVDWTHETRGARVMLAKFVHRMRVVYASAAFARWRESWVTLRWQRKTLARAERYFRRAASASVTKAFNTWAETVVEDKRRRHALDKIVRRWRRLSLSAPFDDWVDWVNEVSANRVKMSKFTHRMKTVYSTRAFWTWRDNRAELARQRRVMARAERYFTRANAQVLTRGFNTWAESASDAKRHRHSLQKIIVRWQRLQLAAPFSDWVEWVDEVRGNRTKLRKFVHRMRTAKTAAAFATWRDAWSESRRRRRLMSRTERFFRRIAMRSTSAAFNAWVHRAAVTKSHRYKLAKLVTRWRRLQLSTPFDDWVQWVDTLTANRAILRRVVHRMRRVKIASAFAAWIDAADSSRAENARLSKMKRVARRFANRTVASAFTALAEHAREVKRLRRSAAAVARRWRRLALSIPFDDWRDAIAGAYRERLVLVRFVHRMRTVVANAAFQRWREFLVDEAATRAIERRAQIMARRWAQKSAAAAFAGWVDAAAARVDVRRALARHVRKWRRVDISYPFITWRDKIAENRRMVGLMERAKRFFGGRVLKNDRARAFQTWKLHYTFVCRVREAEDKEETETQRKNQARVRAQRMVRRWTLRTIAAAFDAWAGFTRERRRLKTSIRKATRRWRLLHVSVPFHDWAAHVEDIRRERLVLGKSVQRMERFQLLAPFQRWQDAVYVRRSERGALLRAERFFTRLLRADTHRALNAWIAHVHSARRVRLELGRVVARWRRAKLAAAFECWRVYYERCEANRAILRKAGARLRSHRVGPAFDTWHANWREGQRTRAALGRARRFVLRVARATLARGFRAFVGHAAERRRLFDALAIVAARWRLRTTSAAFQTWSDRTCEVKAHRATVAKIARRMSRVRLAAAVGKWRDEVSFGRDAWAREKLATRALLRMARRQLAVAFDRLRANCEDAKRGRELLARCRARWGNRALSAAFRTWSLETNRASLERSTLRKAIHRMRTVRVARSFNTWRDTWHTTRALARAWDRCERVFKRRRVAKVRAALNAWYLFSAKARRETLQRQADELMFLQGSLGSERHQKEKVSQELHRTRRESEGLAVLIERLQRETGVLLDQVAERDAQISRLLEERDRSAATRRNDRLSAILASPPRKQRTPPRPPSPEPEPTPVPTSIEIQEADPESPERSDADSDEEDVSRELFPTNDDTPPPSRHLPDAIEPPSRHKLTKAAPSHPSHDPGYYAAAAADWASGRRSPPRDDLSVRLFARVRPFVDGDADKTRSLRPSRPGASDLDVVTRRGEVPFRRTFEFDGGVFWEDDDEVRAASAAAACLADATRRGRDATMLVVGSDKGGKTHVADAVVAACAAFLDLHAFRANERAAAKAEKFEAEKLKAEKSLDTKRRESRADESSEPPFVETRVSMSVYQTRGLHADDLLAGFGGAAGLRVKPGAEYAEAGVGNDESSRHGGLLYEVEELTRVDCADLTDVREMLALARTRRDGHVHRAEATATIAELWVTTSETRVNPGLNPDGTPGSKRTVNRRCVRVVDVRGGDASASTATTPLFNLSQLTRGLAADTNGAAPPDWRRSALTKIMKGPLTGTGTLSVFVATAGSEAHAVDALGALHLAAAAKRLPGRGASHDRGEDRGAAVRVVVERPALSRRERLERTLALARTTARATVVSEGLGEMTTPPGRRSAAERRAIEMSMDAQLTPEHVASGLSPGDASPRTPGRSFRPGPRSASKR